MRRPQLPMQQRLTIINDQRPAAPHQLHLIGREPHLLPNLQVSAWFCKCRPKVLQYESWTQSRKCSRLCTPSSAPRASLRTHPSARAHLLAAAVCQAAVALFHAA